jgi:tRNA A-37 threonylcarbamoyl transferase component Bud32
VREIRRTERVRVHEMEAWDRRVVTKRIRAGSPLRVLADRFRGSAAARAFRLARADQLISDRAAPALAYIDLRRRGWPVESWLLMERVGEEDLDQLVPGDAGEAHHIAAALGRWLAEQHAIGLSHRDLKGGNIRVGRDARSIRFWLVDLQELTGPAILSDDARIEALTQLNASLANEAFDAASRRAALAAYTERLPFSRPREEIARQIAERSLARHHRFRAGDCAPEEAG